MVATARPAMSRGRAWNSAGATTNDSRTMLPTQTPSARTCANLRNADTRLRPSPARAARDDAPGSLAVDELVGRPLHDGILPGAPEDVLFDLLRQREVPLGDPPRGVRLQLDPQLPPGHLEIGMVIGRLA